MNKPRPHSGWMASENVCTKRGTHLTQNVPWRVAAPAWAESPAAPAPPPWGWSRADPSSPPGTAASARTRNSPAPENTSR